MLWFKKKTSVQPATSPVAANGSPSKAQPPSQPPSQDRHILYSLGTVISVKPLERFDIRGEQEGYFLITKGSAELQINGTVDVKPVSEGEWVSTLLIPKSGKFFLSLKSPQDLKLIHLSSTSVEGIDKSTRSQIDKSTRELSKYIKKSLSSMDSFDQSIGEYVRSSLTQCNKSILSQYDSSIFINKSISEISTLPMVAKKFIGLTLSESVSNAEVTAYIKNNPSLTSEVLKVVNSSYHNLRNKVNDINYAVLYLGLSQIFQIVISASLQSIASKSSHLSSINEHSIIISNLAGLLSAPREKRIAPVFSTVGILHDVGEIVKFNIKGKHKDIDFLVEQLSGAKLGSRLLERWGIPESICKAIEIHDQSYYTLPEELDDATRLYVACLHVGHKVCSFIGDDTLPFDPITRAYMNYLGFEDMNIEQLIRLYIVPELRNNANKLPVEVQVFFSI